jgi:hypothetical protein
MPQTKKTPGQKKRQDKMKDMANKRYGMGLGKLKKSKPVNTPGEAKRGFEGMVNRMVSMSESQFNKMIKNIRAKRR